MEQITYTDTERIVGDIRTWEFERMADFAMYSEYLDDETLFPYTTLFRSALMWTQAVMTTTCCPYGTRYRRPALELMPGRDTMRSICS